MAYIKTDEDYYRSLGMSDRAIALEKALEHIDYGVCNPRKAKLAQEAEEEALAAARIDLKLGR